MELAIAVLFLFQVANLVLLLAIYQAVYYSAWLKGKDE
jgi:hypothetical protein